MKKIILISLLAVSLLFSIGGDIYAQKTIEIITNNLVFFAPYNKIRFDCYIKNNGTVNWNYSDGQYVWNYSAAVLNSGTAGASIVAGSSELGSFAPTTISAASNRIQTNLNGAGTGPLLTPGTQLRVCTVEFTTTASSFANVAFGLVYRTTTPAIAVYSADPRTVFSAANRTLTNTIGSEPLPVQIATFTGTTFNKRDVSLMWSTSKETNNRGFDIERKTTEGSWSKIGYVEGKGTTNTVSSYKYEDRNLNVGKYDYRLKQIDNNGNAEYHTLGTVIEIGVPTKYDLSQNYPNPFNPMTKINYDLPFDSRVMILVYDVLGREMKQLVNQQMQKAGYYTIEFNASNFASGIYFYRMISNANGKDFVMTKKMSVIK
jgi:hypothetical protein